MGQWWPRRGTIGKAPLKNVVLELRLGGRWYEDSEDGSQADVGRVRLWDPPNRFVISWEINHHWKPDTTVASEVEVRFVADGLDATIVELEHRDFESLGAEGGASMRRDVDGGWPAILDAFRQAAEG
ncbi:MAG: SRPBCC family protein [Rhodospirillales bacterium]